MTHSDDFIARLEDYLDAFDGATPLPDRVRDAIRAELPSARQVRPRPGLERVSIMLSNAPGVARLGLAAAMMVVAVVLGGAIMNGSGHLGIVGGAPTQSPVPTPTVAASVASPSVAALPPSLNAAPYVACDATDTGKSCVQPGTYRLDDNIEPWAFVVTVDVPQGWFEWSPGTGAEGILVDGGPRYRSGTGWGAVFSTVGDTARDPCDGSKGVVPAVRIDTPQKLAAIMRAWPRFTATAPQPVVVDGHPGISFQLDRSTGASCPGNPSGWMTSTGSGVDLYPMLGYATHSPGAFKIVDTGSGLLVIRTTDFPQTSPAEVAGGRPPDPMAHAADQARLRALLDTVHIVPARTP